MIAVLKAFRVSIYLETSHSPNQISPPLASLFPPRRTSRGVTLRTDVSEVSGRHAAEAVLENQSFNRHCAVTQNKQNNSYRCSTDNTTIFFKDSDIQQCKSLNSSNKTNSLASGKETFLLFLFLSISTFFNYAVKHRVRKRLS